MHIIHAWSTRAILRDYSERQLWLLWYMHLMPSIPASQLENWHKSNSADQKHWRQTNIENNNWYGRLIYLQFCSVALFCCVVCAQALDLVSLVYIYFPHPSLYFTLPDTPAILSQPSPILDLGQSGNLESSPGSCMHCIPCTCRVSLCPQLPERSNLCLYSYLYLYLYLYALHRLHTCRVSF